MPVDDTRHGTNENLIWRVRLFDGPILEDASGIELRRFRSQRVGALLGYLALRLGHPCPREELYEALWPEEDIVVVANRLRVALASLRRQLEPPGTPFGTVLDVSDPGRVRLRSETVWCDTIAFERAFKAGQRNVAARLARGPLLPGCYDEWALEARERFEALCEELGELEPEEEAPPASMSASEGVLPSLSASPETSRQRLPLYLTRFFGREEERRRLSELLAANRLVTLTGPGGTGKTRLAVETARENHLPSVFVPLADLPDPTRVPEAALHALGVSPKANADAVEHLIALLQQRREFLLILDNAEHVVEAAATLSMSLLEAAPELRMLITSRRRLDLPGEIVFPLQPLEPPSLPALPERLLEFPAVALFLDRARIARPDFVVSARHADALVEICSRLQGMPLALELAAARVTAQTPVQIAETLAANLTGLKSRQRGLPERHRSLRAVMQGSLDLLPDELKAFFAALSVFQGGWTAEAAQAVTKAQESEEHLEELTVRSLIVAREDDATGEMRYSFLESLRQFAAEQLTDSERETYSQRHADYFLRLAAPAWQDDVRNLLPLDGEQENLLTALAWGRKSPGEIFWNGVAGFLLFAFVRGHHRIARPWIEAALKAIPSVPDSELRQRLRQGCCLLIADTGRMQVMLDIANDMKADAEANNDPVHMVYAQTYQGYFANDSGNFEEAVRIQKDALQKARNLTFDPLLRRCLALTARALIGYGSPVGFEGEVDLGAMHEVEMLARELMERTPSHSRYAAYAKLTLALALLYAERLEARHYLKEAQRSAFAHQSIALLMYAFFYESWLVRNFGAVEQAAILFGAFQELQERMGYSIMSDGVRLLEEDLQEKLGRETFDTLVRQGRHTPPEQLAFQRIDDIRSVNNAPTSHG